MGLEFDKLVEYEYDIDAASGSILEKGMEYDD